jgi:biopolymer transport protein TolR
MRPEPPRPDMNVTPLVDVVLVLLIIFMVITPQMAAGANVDVPPAGNVDEKTRTSSEPLTVSVTAGGNVFIEKGHVPMADLAAKLEQIHQRDPFRRARIKADKRVPYGHVRLVFKACQEAGFPGVGLQAGEVEKAKKKS